MMHAVIRNALSCDLRGLLTGTRRLTLRRPILLAFGLLFAASLIGQAFSGLAHYNQEQIASNREEITFNLGEITFWPYVTSPSFAVAPWREEWLLD
jgi:hypothetical protein